MSQTDVSKPTNWATKMSVYPVVRLPKQWKDWCQKAGLRAVNSGFRWGRKHDYWCLKGKGRHWRVNCYGEFQCSERYDDFDRWANSHQESERIQLSIEEFRVVVQLLVAKMEHFELINKSTESTQ